MSAQAMTAQQKRHEIRRTWWVWLLWGLAAVLLGVLLLVRPVATVLDLTVFIGVWWLIGGVIDVITALLRRQGPWGWFLITGVISVLAGGFLIGRPVAAVVISTQWLYYLLAFTFVFVGLIRIFAGYRSASGAGYHWTWGSLVVGLLLTVIGIMLLLDPGISQAFQTVTTVAGLMAIASGVTAALFGLRVRSLASD